MNRLRAVLFGAGAMARMHARNALQAGGVELAGVCSRSSGGAAALRQELGVPRPYFPDFRSMVDTTEPDVLFVCVPAARFCCRAGFSATLCTPTGGGKRR